MAELKLKQAGADTPEGEIVMALCEAFRAAALTVGLDATDPQSGFFIATAAAFFCGVQFGQLEVCGAVLPKDQRRFVQSATTNIRQGVKMGRLRGARVERQLGMGGTVQ